MEFIAENLSMAMILNKAQRESLSDFVIYRLSQQGKTMDKPNDPSGDTLQKKYQSQHIWHKKSDLDAWIAQELHLPSTLWGSDRRSNDFITKTSHVIAKLRKKKIIIDWSTTKRTNIYRLADLTSVIQPPKMSLTQTAPKPVETDMKKVFLSIISKGKKDNTYKFALGKTLLDYSKSNAPTGKTHVISYDYLAGEFLRHYWYQRYKFHMKQDFHIKKRPRVISVLEEVFGDRSSHKFKDISPDQLKQARRGILDNIFGKARQKKGLVVPRFQRTSDGINVRDRNTFYDYDDEKRELSLNPKAHRFFRDNYGLLMRALLAEWIKYLERANHGLPMLAAKIDDYSPKRNSLNPYRELFLKHSCECFYCNNMLEKDYIHVDHFIPWSYIFEDSAWNLVLACRNCNLKKHSSLPDDSYLTDLIKRDYKYSKNMNVMQKSLQRLSIKGAWQDEIHNHYKICNEYGFERWVI